MPQFLVYKNKNPKTRSTYPYLVDIQSDLLNDLGTRVVVPLIKRSASTKKPTKKPIKNLMPAVRVDGQEFIMMVPQLAGIAVSDLGAPVGSTVEHRGEVVAALDFLITGI
jgi:toxin CcdB